MCYHSVHRLLHRYLILKKNNCCLCQNHRNQLQINWREKWGSWRNIAALCTYYLFHRSCAIKNSQGMTSYLNVRYSMVNKITRCLNGIGLLAISCTGTHWCYLISCLISKLVVTVIDCPTSIKLRVKVTT